MPHFFMLMIVPLFFQSSWWKIISDTLFWKAIMKILPVAVLFVLFSRSWFIQSRISIFDPRIACRISFDFMKVLLYSTSYDFSVNRVLSTTTSFILCRNHPCVWVLATTLAFVSWSPLWRDFQLNPNLNHSKTGCAFLSVV